MDLQKKLYKSRENKMLCGVCGGIGEYFKIDPTLVRLGFALLCVLAGGGILLYIIALIVMPQAPEEYVPPSASDSQPHTGQEQPASDQTPPSDGDTPIMI